MADFQISIVGAGVIGLALACELSKTFADVVILEKNARFGQETSSRNSEVIHAGIYYPANSLKANLCVQGNKLLYSFCEKYDIPHLRCGKLIVANTPDEELQLHDLLQKGHTNGVHDLKIINQDKIATLEPNISARKALFSPSTGIIDASSYMKRLETQAINQGCQFVYLSEVTGIQYQKDIYHVTLNGDKPDTFEFTTNILINAAGLASDQIAAMLGITNEHLRIQFCRGTYFRIKAPASKLINRLIYPVPYPRLTGVGIHATIDTAGGVKLGPDVEYMQHNIYNYKVNEQRKMMFYESSKSFLPFLKPDDLVPEMVGIRPKIQKEGENTKDFYIAEESSKGFRKLINLIGIESPGLTASLAIAKYVRSLL